MSLCWYNTYIVYFIMNNNIVNKGTGAGGSNTNVSGLAFEKHTDNMQRLLDKGFVKTNMNSSKNGFYLSKVVDDKELIYVTKSGFKLYAKQFLGVSPFREPDECYIVKHKDFIELKIVEKKNQNTEGSVELKLYSGIGLLQEYNKVFSNNFQVSYAFCLSQFFKNKFNSDSIKYQVMQEVLRDNEIEILYGNDENYFELLDEWIGVM